MRFATFAALAGTTQLAGCFFVFIPGSLIDKVAGAPQFCVAPGAKVGDTFTKDGDQYRITEIKGDSQHYCRNSPEWRRLGVDAVAVRRLDAPAPAASAVSQGAQAKQ